MRQRGFSLIELLVGLVILGILLSIGVPAFTNWLRNARVRSTAESIQNGLQLARAEAVRRNLPVRFQLLDSTTNDCALNKAGPGWVVSIDNPEGQCAEKASDVTVPRIIQARSGAESTAAVTVAATEHTVVFNSRGRPTPTPAADITIDFSSATGEACTAKGGPVRCLRTLISIGGQIRMCDPALPAGDAQGC